MEASETQDKDRIEAPAVSVAMSVHPMLAWRCHADCRGETGDRLGSLFGKRTEL